MNDGTTYKRITSTEKTNYNTAYTHSQTTGNAHSVSASQIPCAATGDVSATNIQSAIAELASEKLSTTTAAGTYQPLDSTLTALSGLSSGIPLLTGDADATSINRATLVESLRANSVISGGNVLSVSSTYSIKWEPRFIIISNGKGSHFSTTGYFDIYMPAVGTIITGLGTSDKTVSTNGIELDAWDALYYILPIGSSYNTVDANFRLVNYSYSTEIPETWIPLALRNAAFGYVQFPNGVCLYAGETKTDNWQKQIDGKQDALTFDENPTDGSYNPVRSNGVFGALAGKQPIDSTLTALSRLSSGIPLLTLSLIHI